jgi:hypothetical protein
MGCVKTVLEDFPPCPPACATQPGTLVACEGYHYQHFCDQTNAALCVSNRQIQENLGITFFPDHIRALTESFDSELTDAGTP